MSTPTSHVSQRDQMKARMATEAPSEVLSGFAAAASRLDAVDFAGRAPQLGYYKASFNEVPEIRGYLAPYSETLPFGAVHPGTSAFADDSRRLGTQIVVVPNRSASAGTAQGDPDSMGCSTVADAA
jgi:hypothetical protein